MRQRQIRDVDDDNYQIFEPPPERIYHDSSYGGGHSTNTTRKNDNSRTRKKEAVVLFASPKPSWNYRHWLCLLWLGIWILMIITTWRIVELLVASERQDSEVPFFYYLLPSSFLIWRRNHANKLRARRNNKEQNRKNGLKYILYLNNYWNLPDFQFGEGQQPFLDAGCPVSSCYASHDPSVLSGLHTFEDDRAAFDAVMIHAPEFHYHDVPGVNHWRRPHQRFVFFNMESPLSHIIPDVPTLKSFYNWTMTYRLDSDIPRPYGFFQSTKGRNETSQESQQYYFPVQFQQEQEFLPYTEHHFLQNVLPNKDSGFHKLALRPKKIAWVVSRCYSPSRREDYVKKLREYVDVDILGGCGNIPCDSSLAEHAYRDNCTAAVENSYKFYLSYENSYCNDYVTEKFFKRLKGNSLVVVLGGANYARVAPPHSHLNALDYETPKALAEKLHELDHNNSLYLSYFWWKDHYTVHNGTASDHASSMCRLCEMLHDPTLPPKAYPSMATWHGESTQCWEKLPQVIQNLLPNYGPSPDDDDGEPFDGHDDHL